MDRNATVQFNVLCAYCKSLSDEIDCVLNNTTNQQPTQVPVERRNVFENARNGCHLCTHILNGFDERITYKSVLTSIVHWDWSYLETADQTDLTIVLRMPHGYASPNVDMGEVGSDKVATKIRLSNANKMNGSSGRTTAVSTMSDEHIKLAATWIRQCSDEHVNCPHYKLTWMPTRLIEVTSASKVKLIETKQLGTPVPYYALSYCWGQSPVLTTKKANVGDFKSRIPLPDLPLTIQDAITVVNSLGGRYLWVDSICIIQDNDEDWTNEAETMCDVYQNAYLTIVALGAAGATEGLFGNRDPLAVSDCRLTAGKVIPAPRSPQPSFGVFYASELQRRGWTFQERALAPRKLFFSSYIYWECTNGFEEEVTNGGWYVHELFNTGLVSLQAPSESSALTLDHRGQMNVPEHLALWYRALQDFTARQLTRPTDRLVAISGVIKFLERKLSRHNRYGMWLDFFPCDLLWKLPGWRGTTERLEGLPTWSWASLTATVAPAFDIEKAFLPVKGTRLISVQDFSLTIEGRLLYLSCKDASHPNPRLSPREWRLKALSGAGREQKVRALMDRRGTSRTEFRWTVDGMKGVVDCVGILDLGSSEDNPTVGEHLMLPMIVQVSKHFSKDSPLVHLYGIGIRRSASAPGCFERFGAFDVVFDMRPRRRDRLRTWKDEAEEPIWPQGELQIIQLV